MICSQISELLGFACHPLTKAGNVALIDAPFVFPDGDQIPIFIEKMGHQIRFFDDGDLILHLLGRGVPLNNHQQTRFIRNLAEPNGVTLNDQGELEIWADIHQASTAFAKYMSTMLALAQWEKDNTNAPTNPVLNKVTT